MRIAVLSLPLVDNYGGILQAYALQKILEEMGHEVVFLDMDRIVKLPLLTRWRHYTIKLMKNIIFNAHETIKWDREYNKEIEVKRKYTYLFLQKYIKRIELHRSYSELGKNSFDAIVVGSDQVWRPRFFWHAPLVDAYLAFAKEWDVKRISYAASFGTDEWEYTSKQTIECCRLLKRFNAVSVRESSAVLLCKQQLGVDAQHVLDPTMLFDAEYYIALFKQANTPISEGDLMCYILDSSEQKCELIDFVSETLSLNPFYVDFKYEISVDYQKEKVKSPVEEWLRGFYDAKFVVTDSFHACVFSILFKKPFVVYGNKYRGMARFHSLLSMFGLEDRLVTTLDEASAIISRPINWDGVYTRLTEWRKRSKDFLIKNLSE